MENDQNLNPYESLVTVPMATCLGSALWGPNWLTMVFALLSMVLLGAPSLCGVVSLPTRRQARTVLGPVAWMALGAALALLYGATA